MQNILVMYCVSAFVQIAKLANLILVDAKMSSHVHKTDENTREAEMAGNGWLS